MSALCVNSCIMSRGRIFVNREGAIRCFLELCTTASGAVVVSRKNLSFGGLEIRLEDIHCKLKTLALREC